MSRGSLPSWRGLRLSKAYSAPHARALIGATTSELSGLWLVQAWIVCKSVVLSKVARCSEFHRG